MSGRREMAAAVLGCLLGAALVLLAAGRPWVHAVALQEPVRVPFSVKGASLSPAVPSAGLVCLAGVVGVLAARSVVRRGVGVLIALAGLGAAVASVIEANPDAGELSGRAGETVGTASATATAVDPTLWPWVAVLGALLAAAGGVLTALRSGSWPGMSSRYERPGTAPARTAAPSSDTALEQWRALDRGEDPTL